MTSQARLTEQDQVALRLVVDVLAREELREKLHDSCVVCHGHVHPHADDGRS